MPTPVVLPTAAAPPSAASNPAPNAGFTRSPIETVVLPQQPRPAPVWPWLVGAGILALIAGGLWAALRRGGEGGDGESAPALPVQPPAPAPAPAAEPRARIALQLRPLRAGLNLLTATVDCEITVTNVGDAAAADIAAEVRLMSAHADQDADLAAFYAGATGRPATPPFSLSPGEERRFRTVAALPRETMRVLEAGGRPMLVPLVALAVRYRDGGLERRAGQAFAMGVERVDSAKLAPFWLDATTRQYDSVAARPHGSVVEG